MCDLVATRIGSAVKALKLRPLEPQSRFGDKLLEIRVVCPQNGTAVLKGLRQLSTKPASHWSRYLAA